MNTPNYSHKYELTPEQRKQEKALLESQRLPDRLPQVATRNVKEVLVGRTVSGKTVAVYFDVERFYLDMRLATFLHERLGEILRKP